MTTQEKVSEIQRRLSNARHYESIKMWASAMGEAQAAIKLVHEIASDLEESRKICQELELANSRLSQGRVTTYRESRISLGV